MVDLNRWKPWKDSALVQTKESLIAFCGLHLPKGAHRDTHLVRGKPSHRSLALQSRDERLPTLSNTWRSPPSSLPPQRRRPHHATEERERLQMSTQEPFRPPTSNAKAPRRTAPAMHELRGTVKRRQQRPPSRTAAKAKRQGPTPSAIRAGHSTTGLSCYAGSAVWLRPEDAASRHGSVQQPLPLKSGSDLTDLVHTLCGPIQS